MVQQSKNSSPSAKDKIIFPLDFSSLAEAKPFIKKLKDHIGLFKVGLIELGNLMGLA